MSTIIDLLYREYCRGRLAEMRKQVPIPVASDEILEAHSGSGGNTGRRAVSGALYCAFDRSFDSCR